MKKIISVFKNCQVMKVAIFSLLMLVCASSAFAQTSVKGKVTDDKGNPLTGVSIIVQGTTVGTYSDLDGTYSLVVPARNSKNGVLEFFYMGFKAVKITLDGRAQYNVTLVEDAARLDEAVVVGYGTQKKGSISSAVTYLPGKELLHAPSVGVSNVLSGRVNGIVAIQSSGQPGADASSLYVRGDGAIYIVDGIQRPINELNPTDIENVSVLKDAAAASIYGLNASSVIIVTTKRGKAEKIKFDYLGTYGVSTNTNMLEMLDGPGYAYWYNKAREMDGDAPVFTKDQVDKMLNDDPTDGWGNTNWYKETFGVGTTMNHGFNLSGGNEKTRFFASLGYFDQNGNVKNFNYKKYSLRSNIDTKVAKNLNLTFDISGRIEDRHRPGYTANPLDWNNIPQQALRAHPYVPKEINGLPVSTRTASSFVNPLAGSDLTGYSRTRSAILQTQFTIKYHVPFVQGLSVKFLTSYDMTYSVSKSFSTPYETMVATAPTSMGGDISYTKTFDARGNSASLAEGLTYSEMLTTNTMINYDREFGKHKVSAMLLSETRQTDGNDFSAYGYGYDFFELDELPQDTMEDRRRIEGGSTSTRIAGFAGKFNYEYDNKYIVEFSSRYDGSYLFFGKNGQRWVYLPAGSVAWKVSNEDWFRERFSFVNDLKIRLSYGETATSGGVSPYTYLSTLTTLPNSVVLGGSSQSGLITSKPPIYEFSWSTTGQFNIGLETTLWNGLLGAEIDYYIKNKRGIYETFDAVFPDSFGKYFPTMRNYGKQQMKGFEMTLKHKNRIGDLYYYTKLNLTSSKSTILRTGESPNVPDYLKRTGSDLGAVIGFIAEGLFQSEEEIANSALIPGKPVRVGDIKYRDLNGDGKITYEQDRGYVGKSSIPKVVLGFEFSGEYKGFDFAALLQAGLGRDVALTGIYSGGIMDNTNFTKPFYHGSNSPKFLIENSWREDNKEAEFPRLTIVSASSNNAFSSTYWYRNGDYVRVKSAQLGYTLPYSLMKKSGFEKIRIYVEGQNLLTFSSLSKYNIDPEQPGVNNGYYPQQRVISMGLNIIF